MTEAERLRKFAEGCIYIANGVRDGAEAARLKALAADALAKAEALERQAALSNSSSSTGR